MSTASESTVPSRRNFLIVIGLVVLIGTFGLILAVSMAPDSSTPTSAKEESFIRGLQVQEMDGLVHSLVPEEGGFILVVSETCPYCHDLLELIGEESGSRFLDHLWVVNIQGAESGFPFVVNTDTRAHVVGPFGDVQQWLETVDISNVPTLLVVNSDGKILERTVGPRGQEFARELVSSIESWPASIEAFQSSSSPGID